MNGTVPVLLMGGPADGRTLWVYPWINEIHVPYFSGSWCERHVYAHNSESLWAWYAGEESKR